MRQVLNILSSCKLICRHYRQSVNFSMDFWKGTIESFINWAIWSIYQSFIRCHGQLDTHLYNLLNNALKVISTMINMPMKKTNIWQKFSWIHSTCALQQWQQQCSTCRGDGGYPLLARVIPTTADINNISGGNVIKYFGAIWGSLKLTCFKV